mmetsp:Transcript_27403/g.22654  ORF Transcript_27403/g.22654 Transcript_27403/m.22654 type:complete len:113 (+) Transcript_27403:291-629(+)
MLKDAPVAGGVDQLLDNQVEGLRKLADALWGVKDELLAERELIAAKSKEIIELRTAVDEQKDRLHEKSEEIAILQRESDEMHSLKAEDGLPPDESLVMLRGPLEVGGVTIEL